MVARTGWAALRGNSTAFRKQRRLPCCRSYSNRCAIGVMRPSKLEQEQEFIGIRYPNVTARFVILCLLVGLAVIAALSLYRTYATPRGVNQSVPRNAHISDATPRPEALSTGWAEDNVREVQTKLREGGFYSGEIDGAYSSDLAAALTRYQIRNGLPITGQLDADTSKALGAKPAVATQVSETWRRLRTTTPPETPAIGSPSTEPVAATVSTERVRDYVGAFVLAGLDPQVGAEAAFFADRVQYYDEGTKDRAKIREDLKRYDTRWPQRRFWLAGEITVEPQSDKRVRVTFPLRYELRNGAKHSSGKINKTLLLEPAGDDLQIVAVNERKAE
jgi:peptidoglycan hydrolase-like protein with peptidoglycan-binding domain